MGSVFLRRAALMLGLVVTGVATAPAAVAGPGDDRVPNRLAMNTFTAGGYDVAAHAGRGLQSRVVCASASRVTQAAGRRTVVAQYGCSERADVTYRFDPVTWTAQLEGRMRHTLEREVYENVNGGWVRVSSSRSSATADLDLRWVGRGDPRPIVGVSGFPGSCYALPPICTQAQAVIERAATVSGSLTFNGLGASIDIPVAQGGTIHVP